VLRQQEEEVGVGLEELQRQRVPGGAADRVVPGADAQNGDGHFVHVPQRLVAVPVRLPAPGGVGSGGALFQTSLSQDCPVPSHTTVTHTHKRQDEDIESI
uniref:Uncharacterized protein n=1 Tax=Gadus morhua TaxID=8049 RepID=A0A8C5C2V2_GADMO